MSTNLYIHLTTRALTCESLQVNTRTMNLLFALARRQKLEQKIKAMCSGERINTTENRAVLHTALRAAPDDPRVELNGVNVIDLVHEVLRNVRPAVVNRPVTAVRVRACLEASSNSAVCRYHIYLLSGQEIQ